MTQASRKWIPEEVLYGTGSVKARNRESSPARGNTQVDHKANHAIEVPETTKFESRTSKERHLPLNQPEERSTLQHQ